MFPFSRKLINLLPVQKDLPLESGDIYFCSGVYLQSKIIQLATRSPWSHVGLVWSFGKELEPLFLEAMEGYGVRIAKRSLFTEIGKNGFPYDGPVVVLRHAKMTDSLTTRFLAFALEQLGDPYSYWDLLRIRARAIFRRPRHPKSSHWICSELVAACMKHIGLIPLDCHAEFVTPASIWALPELKLVGRIA